MVAHAPQGVEGGASEADARHVLGTALVTEVLLPLLPDVKRALKKQLSRNLTDFQTSKMVVDLAMKLLDKGFMKDATSQDVRDAFVRLTDEMEGLRARTTDEPDGGPPAGPLKWPKDHMGPKSGEEPSSA